MSETAKRPGWLLQTIAFVIVAIPAWYVGMVLAALPCFDSAPSTYCSAHGGGVIFAGLGLGLLLALVAGITCVRAVKKSFANDTSPLK